MKSFLGVMFPSPPIHCLYSVNQQIPSFFSLTFSWVYSLCSTLTHCNLVTHYPSLYSQKPYFHIFRNCAFVNQWFTSTLVSVSSVESSIDYPCLKTVYTLSLFINLACLFILCYFLFFQYPKWFPLATLLHVFDRSSWHRTPGWVCNAWEHRRWRNTWRHTFRGRAVGGGSGTWAWESDCLGLKYYPLLEIKRNIL